MKRSVVLFAILLCLSACTKKEAGYHAPWHEMVEYSFPLYKEHNMDSMQFYNYVVMKKNAEGACRFLVTPMASYAENELNMRFNLGDVDATMELLARSRGNKGITEPYSEDELNYIKLAAAKGNRYAVILQHMLKGEYESIKPYTGKSPLAAYVMAMHEQNNDAPELAQLRKLDGYPYLMAAAATFNPQQVDRDAFCEAYLQGCDLLEVKTKYRIICQIY
jgi:hypothetical protein